MKINQELVSEVLKKIFVKSRAYSENDINEIVFNLTDWIEDLTPFTEFLENPAHYEDDAVMQIVIRFLAHAPDHLKRAAELVLDPDEKD